MTTVKTEIGAKDQAYNTRFAPTTEIVETDVQRAIEAAVALIPAPGAPIDGDYVVGSANGSLTAERVATDTTTIDVDMATPGQAKWNVLEVPGIDAAGMVARTGAANYEARTLTGTTNEITVTNGDGVSGNPTLSLPTNIILTNKNIDEVEKLGINTTADTTNRLSVNSAAVLFNHNGDTSQVKVNKNATGDTASHLFQVGFSGRAEFGLIGDNDFQMKTSPDGSVFTTGLTILNSSAALRAHVNLSPAANDGAALGTTALGWADAFFATGGTIHFANTDWVATHTTGILTVGTGDLRVTTAGTNSASVVTVGGTQTLTGKTLTSPAINGGTIDGTVIGGTSAANGTFTTLTVNTNANPDANDGAALGTSALGWSDLFLASGGVVNWNNGNVTMTHAAGEVRISGPAQTVLAISPVGNGGIELGRIDGTLSTPFLDFHSGATAVDYDSRLLASGGSGADGGGTLNAVCAAFQLNGVPIFSNLPQNSQSTAYTTVLADAQKHILHPTADNNARTFTIAANASVAYPIGTAITFVNQINVVTIAINSDTLVLAGAGTTGSRSLAANGMATALKIASTTWMISGTGLT